MNAEHDPTPLDDLKEIQREGRRRTLRAARPALIVLGVFAVVDVLLLVLFPDLRTPAGVAALILVEAVVAARVAIKAASGMP